jgi:hypothetical protein
MQRTRKTLPRDDSDIVIAKRRGNGMIKGPGSGG